MMELNFFHVKQNRKPDALGRVLSLNDNGDDTCEMIIQRNLFYKIKNNSYIKIFGEYLFIKSIEKLGCLFYKLHVTRGCLGSKKNNCIHKDDLVWQLDIEIKKGLG